MSKSNWWRELRLKLYFRRMDRKRKRVRDKYNKENKNNSYKI